MHLSHRSWFAEHRPGPPVYHAKAADAEPSIITLCGRTIQNPSLTLVPEEHIINRTGRAKLCADCVRLDRYL